MEFHHVCLRYGENSRDILKNVSFKTAANEKIGIVGRTGAGKSSLITALFRLSEPTGTILVDDIDTKTMELHDLRKNISIIPQGKGLIELFLSCRKLIVQQAKNSVLEDSFLLPKIS